MIDIKIDKFQGPLSLLLKIIEKEELDITQVNLAKIADEYLEYIKNSPEIAPESMADFLLMAAKLLYIKSRALLPYLLSEEEQEELDDLEGKLKMYKDFVVLSSEIQKMIGRKKFSFFRTVPKTGRRYSFLEKAFFPPKNIKIENLFQEFKRILDGIEFLEEKLDEKTIISEVNIEERIVFIRGLVSRKIKINFTRFLKESKTKVEIIVSFLAILELVKQKELTFNQGDLFSDIFLEPYN